MRVKYTLYNGVPNFTVTLASEDNTYVNTHTTRGTFDFHGVASGTYELTAVDSTGCEYEFGQVVVENELIYLSSTMTQDNPNSQDTGDLFIQSLSRKYLLTINPKFPDGLVTNLEFGYNLITEESPVDAGDDVYGQASIEGLKDGVVVFQDQATSNGTATKSGTFTITGVANGTIVEFTGSVLKRSKAAEGKTSSGFFEIYPLSVGISEALVTMVTTSFNINGNIA
jgi:hypothetical protein